MEHKNNGKTPNRVAQLRIERGWSQRELSEKVFLNQRTISNIEGGFCSLLSITALADTFGVTLDYILKRSDDRGNELEQVEEIDFLILGQLKEFSKAEKERLLEHLKLDNSLKIHNGK